MLHLICSQRSKI